MQTTELVEHLRVLTGEQPALPVFVKDGGLHVPLGHQLAEGRLCRHDSDRPGLHQTAGAVAEQASQSVDARAVVAEAAQPGEIRHLPFTWPQEARETKWQPASACPWSE